MLKIFSELFSEKINDTANSLPILSKQLINVGTMSSIEVSHLIVNFLKNENTVDGLAPQLNLFE